MSKILRQCLEQRKSSVSGKDPTSLCIARSGALSFCYKEYITFIKKRETWLPALPQNCRVCSGWAPGPCASLYRVPGQLSGEILCNGITWDPQGTMRETEHDWQLAEARSASLGPGTNTGFSSKNKVGPIK